MSGRDEIVELLGPLDHEAERFELGARRCLGRVLEDRYDLLALALRDDDLHGLTWLEHRPCGRDLADDGPGGPALGVVLIHSLRHEAVRREQLERLLVRPADDIHERDRLDPRIELDGDDLVGRDDDGGQRQLVPHDVLADALARFGDRLVRQVPAVELGDRRLERETTKLRHGDRRRLRVVGEVVEEQEASEHEGDDGEDRPEHVPAVRRGGS